MAHVAHVAHVREPAGAARDVFGCPAAPALPAAAQRRHWNGPVHQRQAAHGTDEMWQSCSKSPPAT